jgi:NAD(P)-dependent dehydrogenase (short-subunit alcohol dehydrogenase family)
MKRIALVTGGSRGIGLGIARHLALEGFDLAVNDIRDPAEVKPALSELERAGARAVYCQGDVGNLEAHRSILTAVREAFGGLHVLVNNAGVAPKERKDILESTEESFERVLRINLYGPYFLSQKAAKWMIEQKTADPGFRGLIVNVSSVSATYASINRGEYCISKAGLSMVTKLFATRLGEYDIPVYEIRPGVIRTDMTAPKADLYDRLIQEGLTVQKRWGMPDDVGKAVAALAEGSFPYSTGQVVMVDGGMSLLRL